MAVQEAETRKKESRLARLSSLIDRLMKYLIVGGGAYASLYAPEAMKHVILLTLAYALAKAAARELAREGGRKAAIAEKAAASMEKALREMGVEPEQVVKEKA